MTAKFSLVSIVSRILYLLSHKPFHFKFTEALNLLINLTDSLNWQGIFQYPLESNVCL